MEFKLLGPLAVIEDGRTIALGGPKQRLVLAILLLRANQTVGTEELIDEVWGDEPPAAARGTLQSYVSHLRRLVGSGRIAGGSSGYSLSLLPEECDGLRFEELLREARDVIQRDPAGAAETIRRALALWHGNALSDLADEPSLRPDITRLEELRLAAIEERIDADLALGRHVDLVPELQSIIGRQPLRERLRGQLMLALYRSGRQAEALDAYRRARQILSDDLGIDPSAELQRLHEQILNQDPALEVGGLPLRGYRLLEEVGEGSLGVVHRAIQPQVGREVAVKTVHRWLANHPDFILRFETEAQLVARLEHPHIVPLYDYWRQPDAAYLVMRFMRGGSLETALSAGSIDSKRACNVVDQIASALAAAHRLGVVHGDVKTANVFFDEDGNAYLADFVNARLPEQRADIGVCGDLSALGRVASEMLADGNPAARAVIARATSAQPGERYEDTQEFAAAFRRALEPGTALPVVPLRDVRNPYKGLRPFFQADASDFFGRDALIERLVARLQEDGDGSRLLAVVGPSGSGKSSVVRAGLVPAVRRGGLFGSERCFAVEMVPGLHPFEELERALLGIAVSPPEHLAELLRRDALGLVSAVQGLLPDDGAELLLVVDQFEELFGLVSEEDRKAFLACLTAAVTDPRSRIRVVVTLRADFYDRPLLYRGFGELIAARTQPVTPLSVSDLERAVAGPAERVGVAVEPRLLADVVSEVADQAGSLPLLQYALTELFDRCDDGVLTLEAYEAIGGVSGALVRRADELYLASDDAGRRAARQVFLRLVDVDEDGVNDRRRRALRAELASLDVDRDGLDRIIDAFGRHRLLTFDHDPLTRGSTVEVAHEALLREWGRLKGWIEEARDDLRVQRRLAASAAEWIAAGREPSFLLRGSRLERLESWTVASDLALTEVEREYIQASLGQREDDRAIEEERELRERVLERRSLRRMRALVVVLALAATLASSLSVVALGQRHRARTDVLVAKARELAAASVANLAVDPQRSLLLALEAVRVSRASGLSVGRETVEALHRAVGESRVELSLSGPGGQVDISPDGSLIATSGREGGTGNDVGDATVWNLKTRKPVATLIGHRDVINDIEFSPDSSRVVTTSNDNTAILWDARTGKRLVTFKGHRGWVLYAAFSPDGTRVATASIDQTVRIWDEATGRELLRLQDQKKDYFCAVAFSPDGKQVVASSCFTTQVSGATVWDARTGKATLSFEGHSGDTRGVAFSPDGRLIATVGIDGTIQLRDARTGVLVRAIEGNASQLWSVDFSPDGVLLATGSNDSSVKLWDVRTGTEVLALRGHTGGVINVRFDGTGARLATGSEDGTERIWDVRTQGRSESPVPGPWSRSVDGVAYSPDGRRLLVAAGDVTLWDAASASKLATLSRIDGKTITARSATFAPDGNEVIVAGEVGGSPVVVLWDPAAGRFARVFRPWTDVSDAVLSPLGTLLVTTETDGSFQLWNPSTGALLTTRRQVIGGSDPIDTVSRAAFSRDGARLVTAGWDGTAKVWDPNSWADPVTVEHQGRVNGAAFSPDGRRIVTGSADGTAAVWDSTSGRKLATMIGHTGGVSDAIFNPSGTLVATAGDDGTARLWDPATGEELLTLEGSSLGLNVGSSLGLNEVAFDPSGSRLITASRDGALRAYILNLDELVNLARTRVTRTLTTAECRQYLHVGKCPPPY